MLFSLLFFLGMSRRLLKWTTPATSNFKRYSRHSRSVFMDNADHIIQLIYIHITQFALAPLTLSPPLCSLYCLSTSSNPHHLKPSPSPPPSSPLPLHLTSSNLILTSNPHHHLHPPHYCHSPSPHQTSSPQILTITSTLYNLTTPAHRR